MKQAVIFVNGNLSSTKKAKENIDKDDFVVCTDGAVRYALVNQIIPQVVIGDMDSLTPSL